MGSDGMSPRRAATRDRLCDAAMGVIAEKGVLGASIGYVAGARITPALGAERVICWVRAG